MAASGLQLDPEQFRCRLCGLLLQEPASVPCGHSFCLSCVSAHWDETQPSYSCPQCGHEFNQRPVLTINTLLDVLMEQLQKRAAPLVPVAPVAPAAPCYTDLGDVGCDLCGPGTKRRRAVKSCVQCLVSYCGEHVRPHAELPALKRHELVEPVEREQDAVCPRHGAARDVFCRSEQLRVCCRCAEEEHRGHHTVSIAAERSHRRERLHRAKEDLHQRLCYREKDVVKLQQRLRTVRDSADSAVDLCDRSLPELTRLLKIRMEKVKEEMRALQESEERPFRDLKDKLEEDIARLTSKKAELEQLEEIADPAKFLQKFLSLLEYINGLDYDVYRDEMIDKHTLPLLSVVRSTVRELQAALQSSEKQEITHCYAKRNWQQTEGEEGDNKKEEEKEHRGVLALAGRTASKLWDVRKIYTDNKNGLTHLYSERTIRLRREEFLPYARDVTFDLDTAHSNIVLSEENRRAKTVARRQSYRKKPERFSRFCQVLSKEPLTGRCYFEVKLDYDGMIVIALTYEDIERKGPFAACDLNSNPNSWALTCYHGDLIDFRHNKARGEIWWSGLDPDTMGVFLDHDMGILEFYCAEEDHENPPALLHEVHTTFTKPLYLGVGFIAAPHSVEIVKLT